MIRFLFAFLLTAAGAIPAMVRAQDVAEGPMTDEIVEEVRSVCGLPQAQVIDARPVATVEALRDGLPDLGVPFAVYGGVFPEADFSAIAPALENACFYLTDLSGSRWEGVSISGLNFVQAKLANAQFLAARLRSVRFVGVDLSGADLSESEMPGGRWVGAYWSSNLENANFHGARLTHFAFECSIILSDACGNNANATFAQVDFTGADLVTLPIYGFDNLAGARFDRTLIDAQALAYLDESVDFAGPVFVPVEWSEDAAQRKVVAFSPQDIATIRQHLVPKPGLQGASFDCDQATSQVEKLICGEWAFDLRRLDRDLAEVYARVLAKGLTDANRQRAWLRERNRCADEGCVRLAYQARLEVLLAAEGPVRDFRPGEVRHYQEEVLALDDAFRSSELFRRLLPALAVSSLQQVTLTMRADGTIDATGTSVGANAHTCDLEVHGARFDPASGWYGGQGEDGARIPLFRLRGRELEFRYSGNMGDTPDEASDFISCGMRAGFSTLVDPTR